MFVVDTNVLVYAADKDSPYHAICRCLVDRWRLEVAPWHLTWGIVYEFLRVTTHHRVFRRPLSLAEAWQFIDALLASPSLRMLQETPHHPAIAAAVFSEMPQMAGNLLFDARTVILMRENGVATIYTKDADFAQFRDLTVIDPLTCHP